MVLDLLHMFPLHRSSIITIIYHHSSSLDSTLELIDCLCMGPVLGQALADVPCIQSWCLTV